MSGELDVLNTGEGHLKMSFSNGTQEDIDRARRIITEMMDRGYIIMIETKKGPRRVKKFSPKRMTYLIDDAPDRPQNKDDRKRTREVPVDKSKGTAVGRTAGG